MSRPFNQLTPAEDERLAFLIEECSEVIKAAAKIQRHGFESKDPTIPVEDKPPTNRETLELEMGDVLAAINMTFAAGDTNAANIYTRQAVKLEEVKEWMHHQGGRRRAK